MHYFYAIAIKWSSSGSDNYKTITGNIRSSHDCSGCRYWSALELVARQAGVNTNRVSVLSYFEGPTCGGDHPTKTIES